MKTRSVRRIGVVLLLFVALVLIGARPKDEKDLPRWMQLDLIKLRASQTPIKFYGRVVDLDGNPMAGAEVTVEASSCTHWPKQGRYITRTIKTDADGQFVVNASTFDRKKLKGDSLSIEDIRQKGYEFSIGNNPTRSFEYRSDYTALHKADKSKPVVFYLRKRGELVYLLHHRMRSGFAVGSLEAPGKDWVDFVAGKTVDQEARWKWERRNKPHWDMEILTVHDPEQKAYTVTYRMLDKGAGLLLTKDRPYLVPEDGHQPEMTMHYPARDRSPRQTFYLSVKCRNPAIYAVVKVEATITSSRCKNVIEFLVNPYGGRGFEYKKNHIPHDLEDHLEKEAIKALSAGRLPEKPDLPKLIAEYHRQQDLQAPVEFYGRAVDQGGKPVEGAVVRMEVANAEHWPRENKRRGKETTDKDGQFAVTFSSFRRTVPYKVSALQIRDIRKNGYAFKPDKNPVLSFSYRTDDPARHKPSKKNPVVFHLSKNIEQ